MGFGAFLVTFCAGKKSPGARGRAAPEAPRFRDEAIFPRSHPTTDKSTHYSEKIVREPPPKEEITNDIHGTAH